MQRVRTLVRLQIHGQDVKDLNIPKTTSAAILQMYLHAHVALAKALARFHSSVQDYADTFREAPKIRKEEDGCYRKYQRR